MTPETRSSKIQRATVAHNQAVFCSSVQVLFCPLAQAGRSGKNVWLAHKPSNATCTCSAQPWRYWPMIVGEGADDTMAVIGTEDSNLGCVHQSNRRKGPPP